jgi:2,3-bisphosphoglycerate-dependent phosphoglycerate mutase
MPLILLRHGQSVWNLENRFTGWVDVDLTDQGKAEAVSAGETLKSAGLMPDVVFVSPLKRAKETGQRVLSALGCSVTPQESPEMIERFYGALTGLNKEETAEAHGADQVHIWRRSYDQAPPALLENHDHHPANNPLFQNFPFRLPATESLKDVVGRVEPFYRNILSPLLNQNKTVLIVAHGNSIRALIKLMAGLSDPQIESVEIPTGRPVILTPEGQHWQYKILSSS